MKTNWYRGVPVHYHNKRFEEQGLFPQEALRFQSIWSQCAVLELEASLDSTVCALTRFEEENSNLA